MDNNINSKWHQIIIDDPGCLPGKIIFDVIHYLLKFVHFKYVILNDIVGAAQNGLMPLLWDMENSAIELDDFLNIVCNVQQFDFGDFFLFKEYPATWDNPEITTYPYLIAQTDTTVRAIDDQYVYIYTPFKTIADGLELTNYKIESIKTNFLDQLEYPT